jgi:hypothetical protein
LTTHPYLAPGLKKELIQTSTASRDLNDLFCGEIYRFIFTFM